MKIISWLLDQVVDYVASLERQLDKKYLLLAGVLIAVLFLICLGLLWLSSVTIE